MVKKRIKNVKPDEVITEQVEEKKTEVIEQEVHDEAINIDENIVGEESPKEEKKRRFFDEVKSFFILVIILGVVILAGWLFYKYAKPIKDDEKLENKIVETDEYKTVVYSTSVDNGRLKLVGDNYLIETADDKLVKIMNRYSEVVYEAIDEESYYFLEGIDGNLYAIEYLDYEFEPSIFNLYVLENGKLVQVKEFIDDNTTYNLIIFFNYDNSNYTSLISDENTGKLIGVYSNKAYMDENLNEINERKVYTLDNNEYDLGENYLDCDIERLGEDVSYITASERYIVINNSQGKYGLYDLQEGKVIIEPDYDGLYTANDGNYVAIKNGKAGIINRKLKKLVDFEYDFIDINDGFYVVSKDSKLAIMNSEHKLITKFEFDYQSLTDDIGYSYKLCCTNFNTFRVLKFNDYYILTINNLELAYGGFDYKKSETYIISEDGTYKTIKANDFGIYEKNAFAYSKKDKKYELYNTDNFELVSTIDLSDYDFEEYPSASIDDNILYVLLDSELYFNIETGEELETLNDNSVIINGEMKLEVDRNNNKARIMVGEDEIATVDITDKFYTYNFREEDSSYFITSDSYILVEKR